MFRQRVGSVLAVMAGVALMVAVGSSGYTGAGGYSGADGYAGADGYSGADGHAGADGYGGADGHTEADGYNKSDAYDRSGPYSETMYKIPYQDQDSSEAGAAGSNVDGERAGKQKIVLGAPWRISQFQWEAACFNAQSEDYYVELLQFSELGDEKTYPDEITADLIDVRYMHLGRAAAEGRLEPLDDWLAHSDVLDREDFLGNVLASATYNGRLYAIPREFTVKTVVCKDSLWDWPEQFGQKELIDFYEGFSERHPGAKLFDGMFKNELIYYCVGHDASIWPDYGMGSCNFESEEFKEVLRFIKRSSKTRNRSIEDHLPEALSSEKVLFDSVYLNNFRDVQFAPAMFGEPVAYVGYPGKDGGRACVLEPSDILAVNASSEHKEGAWAFLEFYLSHWGGAWQTTGFPSNAEALQAKCREELLSYEDAKAKPFTEEIGEWEYTYHKCTQKEIAQMYGLIARADVQNMENLREDQAVLEIILEESSLYFSNQKSVDHVASVIQARVQRYMQAH